MQQTTDRRRALELECEQARYAVQLAQRRYEAVDPDHRLVASELEARWNAALAHVGTCEARLDEPVVTDASVPDREALLRLAVDLRAAWDAPTADTRVKQQLVRTLRDRSEVVHQLVQQVGQPGSHFAREMRVDLGRPSTAMAEGVLEDPQIDAGFQSCRMRRSGRRSRRPDALPS